MTGFAANDPNFLDAELDLDAVLRVAMEIASEVWVLRDRFTVLEELLDEHGSVTREQLDRHQPSPTLSVELETQRRRFLQRIVEAASPHDSVVPHQREAT